MSARRGVEPLVEATGGTGTSTLGLTGPGVRSRSVARRRFADYFIKVFAWCGALIGITVMIFLVYQVAKRGLPAVMNWAFWTQTTPMDVMSETGGLANAMVGTLAIMGVAAAMAIPVGFASGVYLAEFGRNGRLATAIRTIINVIMGVPSIVVGVFIFALLVKPLGHYSGFAGSLALGFLMLPVMARTTEDILNLVPNELRESGLAMGAPRWKVTLGVVCRAARKGLVTGSLLAVIRETGETAPLLFTALSSPFWLTGLTGDGGFFGGPVANLTKTVYDLAGSPYEYWQNLAWGGAFVIIAAVLGMNIFVRVVFTRGKDG